LAEIFVSDPARVNNLALGGRATVKEFVVNPCRDDILQPRVANGGDAVNSRALKPVHELWVLVVVLMARENT